MISNSDNADFYNKLAPIYDSLYTTKYDEKIDKMIISILKPLIIGKSIIDAGCGTGQLLKLIEIDPSKYLGYDISCEMINIAKKKYPSYDFIISQHPIRYLSNEITIFLFSLNYMGISIISEMMEGSQVFAVVLNKNRFQNEKYKSIYGGMGEPIEIATLQQYINIIKSGDIGNEYYYIYGEVK